jgi:tRNA(Ile2) C34 agmatinyltransferase TiaS
VGTFQKCGMKATRSTDQAEPVEARAAEEVNIKTLLTEYKDNEVRADAAFKGHFVRVSGVVDNIKKDIMGSMYVTVGTGRQFEIPQVQCTLKEDQQSTAASLSKGNKVTVRGDVRGLMMNVQIGDCEIL